MIVFANINSLTLNKRRKKIRYTEKLTEEHATTDRNQKNTFTLAINQIWLNVPDAGNQITTKYNSRFCGSERDPHEID